MADEKRKTTNSRSPSAKVPTAGPTDEELLRLYLKLPKQERRELFADTARAAELTDLSQRTIQLWIETGAIRAVPIGKKYQIYLESLRDFLEKQTKKASAN